MLKISPIPENAFYLEYNISARNLMKGLYASNLFNACQRILPIIKYFCREPYEGLLCLKYVLVSNIASQDYYYYFYHYYHYY